MKKRVLAFVAAFAVCVSLVCVPAHATEYRSGNGFGQWLMTLSDGSGYRAFMNYLTLGTGCPVNQDGKHRAHITVDNLITDATSQWFGYYQCVCEDCGNTFFGAPSDIETAVEDAYDDYVQTMPLNGIDSEGGFLWYPTWSDVTEWRILCNTLYINQTNSLPILENGRYVTFGSSRHVYARNHEQAAAQSITLSFNNTLIIPLSGSYTRLATEGARHCCNGNTRTGEYSESSLGVQVSGQTISCSVNATPGLSGAEHDCYGILPVFRVVPVEQFPVDTNVKYQDDTRPGNINLDITIDYNNPAPAPSNDIVNETTNTVYNPVTGDTTTYNSWQYDYSTRTYTFDNSQGGTTTVTYGDQYITITEGSTTYNVYYLMTIPEHTHSYTESVTRAANCTNSGVKTFTCSCGDTYTQTIPALGHDWAVKSQVQTEYDANGELVTQGYTIYRCTRCGEERRSEDGIPPATGGGGSGGELIPSDENGLQTVRNQLVSFFNDLPAMFGELTNFLNDTFAYIPEEIMYMISFAVTLSVAVAFVKFLWR